MASGNRRYWVVSPNVKNFNPSVGDWRQASITQQAAFMGWDPDDPGHSDIGRKFAGKVAGGIEPGDVILIARRHNSLPQVVGFGVVEGEAKTTLPDFNPPDEFGSLRKLHPFVPWSGPRADVDLRSAVGHTRALVQLHPNFNDAHRAICDWMERHLERSSAPQVEAGDQLTRGKQRRRAQRSDEPPARDIALVALPGNYQLDYEVRSRAEVKRAQRHEARLVGNYRRWLENQDRELCTVKIGALQCDAYEKLRRNLIEAKASASREHIRMAVGQLLDYAFQGGSQLQGSQMAILLPEKPPDDVEAWLDSLNIKLIWPQVSAFLDNANGQFT
jgi:hypothetical protein